jgi:hypothetical protein
MRYTLTRAGNAVLLLLLAALLVGCVGSGDEYGRFDNETTRSTPDKYLRFFNQQQGDLDDTATYNAAVDPGNARRTDGSGNIIPPGRVVARVEPDRVTSSGPPVAPITLDAAASLFADSYRWELLSAPPAATATLTSPNSRRTDFSADTDGKYVVRLTATSFERGSSHADTVTILLDGALVTPPRAFTFYTDITAVFGAECVSCHMSGGSVAGIPMWWTGYGAQSFAVSPVATPSLGLFEQAMTQVIPEYI